MLDIIGKTNLKRWLPPLIVLILAVVYFVTLFQFNFDGLEAYAEGDQGLFANVPYRLYLGKILYKDVFGCNYTPGYWYLIAAIYKIFGVNLRYVATSLGLSFAISAFLTYLIARKYMPEKYALTAFALILLTGFPINNLGYAAIYCCVFLLCQVISLMTYNRSSRFYWLILAGLFCGLSFSFKFTVGIFLFGANILFLCFNDRSRAINQDINSILKFVKWVLIPFLAALSTIFLVKDNLNAFTILVYCSPTIALCIWMIFVKPPTTIAANLPGENTVKQSDFRFWLESILTTIGFLVPISAWMIPLSIYSSFKWVFYSSLILPAAQGKTFYFPLQLPAINYLFLYLAPIVLFFILFGLKTKRDVITRPIIWTYSITIFLIASLLILRSGPTLSWILWIYLPATEFVLRNYYTILSILAFLGVLGLILTGIYRSRGEKRILSIQNFLFTFLPIILFFLFLIIPRLYLSQSKLLNPSLVYYLWVIFPSIAFWALLPILFFKKGLEKETLKDMVLFSCFNNMILLQNYPNNDNLHFSWAAHLAFLLFMYSVFQYDKIRKEAALTTDKKSFFNPYIIKHAPWIFIFAIFFAGAICYIINKGSRYLKEDFVILNQERAAIYYPVSDVKMASNVIEYIEKNIPSDKTMIGIPAAFYNFLTGRQNPLYTDYFGINYFNQIEQKALARELVQKSPAYVIARASPEPYFDYTYFKKAFPSLYEIIKNRYKEETWIDKYLILKRDLKDEFKFER